MQRLLSVTLKKSQSTREHKEELYRIRVVSRHLGHKLMAEITAQYLSQYRDFRLQSVSNDTLRRERALLSHLYNVVRIDWGWSSFITSNPVSLVRKPQPNKSRNRRITEEELKLILEQIHRTGHGGGFPMAPLPWSCC